MQQQCFWRAGALVLALAGVSFGASAEDGATYTWQPGGVDYLLSNPANWAGGGGIDLTSGTQTLSFPSVLSSQSPTLSGNVSVYHLDFGSNVDGGGYFQFTRPAGTDYTITVGEGGIFHNNGGGRYFQFNVPLVFKGDQTWEAWGPDLYMSDYPISEADPANPITITKKGGGLVSLQGADSSFAGTINILKGKVAFGAVNPVGPNATIRTGDLDGDGGTCEVASSGVIPCKVVCDGCFGSGGNSAINVNWGGGEISGPVEYVCYLQRTFARVPGYHPSYASTLVFSGGITGAGDTRIVFPAGSGTCQPASIVVRNKPWVSTGAVKCTSGSLHTDGSYGRLVLEAVSNKFAAVGFDSGDYRWCECDIVTKVDWAFDAEDMPVYLGNRSRFDLCGTKQRIGSLAMNAGGEYYPVAICNSSVTPATLFVKQTIDYTQDGDFEGNLNLVLCGSATMTINRASAATGDLTVQSGCLAFTENGSWKGAAHLTIGDGAVVTTAAAGTFGENLSLAIEGAGRLALGGDMTVMTAKVGGQRLPAGRYAKTGSDGVTECAALDGDGVLTVLFSNVIEVIDGTLTVAENDSVTLDANTACETFSKIVLGDGATLAVTDEAYMPTSRDYAFELGADATLVLPAGVYYYCTTVTMAGESRRGWLDFGGGRVYAAVGEGTTHVWKNGASGDRSMGNAENWDVLPDFKSGLANLEFPDITVDSDPIVHDTLFVNKLVFGLVPWGISYNELLNGGSGSIVLGEGGIYHHNRYQRFHDIEVPTYLFGDQTWEIFGNQFYFGSNAPLHDYWPDRPATITKTGDGLLFLEGTGGTFSGTFDIQGGGIGFYYPDVLGEKATVRVQEAAQCRMENTRVSAKFDFPRVGQGWNRFEVYGWCGTAEIAGPVSYTSEADRFFCGLETFRTTQVVQPSTLVFSGGVTGIGSTRFGTHSQSGEDEVCHPTTFIVTNKPWKASGALKSACEAHTPNGRYAKMVFAAAGNEFTSLGYSNDGLNWSNCDIDTPVDWAFDKSDMPVYLGAKSYWDLCGTEQRVGTLLMHPYVASGVEADLSKYPMVTNSSEKAATLYVNQTEADWTQLGDFGGELNLDVSGSKTMTIDRPSTAHGSLAVHGDAKLVFAAGGSWKKLTTLEVTDAAKVTVTDAATFGRKPKAIVKLASWDSLSLVAGLKQPVLELWVGGVKQWPGDYAFGEGTLCVGPWGLTIQVR